MKAKLGIALTLATLVVACSNPSSSSTNTSTSASDATLKSLSLTSGTLIPAFDPAQTTYFAYFDKVPAGLALQATATSPGARLDIQGIDGLKDGGEVTTWAWVKSQDGKSFTNYYVTVVVNKAFAAPIPPTNRSITDPRVVAKGVWFNAKPTSLWVAFGGATTTSITYSDDNSWTASIDTSVIPNGPDKVLSYLAVMPENEVQEGGYSNFSYSGSPQVTGRSLSGSISLPAGVTPSADDELDIIVSREVAGNEVTEINKALAVSATSGPSLSYELTGVADGQVSVGAVYSAASQNYRNFSAQATVTIGDGTNTADLSLSSQS